MTDDAERRRSSSKDSKIYRRLLRNTASNYIGTLFSLAAGFLLTPFLLRHLGVATFGLWVLVTSFVNYGQLFDLGIFGALTKYVAEHRVTKDVEQIRRLISASLVLYSILGLVVVAVGFAVAPLFPNLFNVPEAERNDAVRVVMLMGVWVGLSIGAAAPGAILKGMHRFDLLNLVNVVGSIFSTVGMIIVLLVGGGILGLAIVNIVVTLVMRAMNVWFVRRYAPELVVGIRGADRASIRRILSFSSSIFMGQTAKRLQTKTDLIVIGALMSVVAVTPYAISLRLSNIVRRLVHQFLGVLLPMASELHAEGDWARLRSVYVMSVRLTLVITLPLCMAFAGLAGPFLSMWVGPQYAEYSHLVVILMIAVVVSLTVWPSESFLQGMNRYRMLAISALVSGFANLALSIILGRWIGLTGVALGTLIPTVAEGFGFVLPYTLRVLQIPFRDVVQGIILPAFLPALPAGTSLILLSQVINPHTFAQISVVAATSVVLYVASYLTFGASKVERTAYRDFAASTFRMAGLYLRRI